MRPNNVLVETIRQRFRTGPPVPEGAPYDGEQHESEQSKRERLGEEGYLRQRQDEIYELRATGATIREIASLMGVNYQTVLDDLDAETARRSAGMGDSQTQVTLSVTRYEGVILRALNRLAVSPRARRMAYFDEKLILEAQEHIDRVLGLLRVTPGLEGSQTPDMASTTALILETFASLPAEAKLELLQRVRERKNGKLNGEAVRR